MPVKVKTTQLDRGSNLVVDSHDRGQNIYITEGHLFVESNSVGVVAVYAPGKWVSAETVTATD